MLQLTQVRVHLGNIRDNIETLRRIIGPDRRLLVPVKGNAYGHGAVGVGRLAEACGVDWLGVATVPEGQELRAAGIARPILVLSPTLPDALEAALDAGLTPTLSSRAQALALQGACRARGTTTKVHLELETGMGRSGVPAAEAAAMAAFLAVECPALELQGASTHLPASDGPDLAYTDDQVRRFRAAVAQLEAALGHPLELVHCANSGGVLRVPEAWLTMVRPGISVYGLYTGPGAGIAFKPGLSFSTRLVFARPAAAGETVGYGRTWTAPRDTVIGTLGCGYADGFNRLFSNRGRVLIAGRACPVIGRVCMNQTMVDLGPDAQDQPGDEVTLIGRSGALEITAQEWAESLGTITYEVACQISARVERVFEP